MFPTTSGRSSLRASPNVHRDHRRRRSPRRTHRRPRPRDTDRHRRRPARRLEPRRALPAVVIALGTVSGTTVPGPGDNWPRPRSLWSGPICTSRPTRALGRRSRASTSVQGTVLGPLVRLPPCDGQACPPRARRSWAARRSPVSQPRPRAARELHHRRQRQRVHRHRAQGEVPRTPRWHPPPLPQHPTSPPRPGGATAAAPPPPRLAPPPTPSAPLSTTPHRYQWWSGREKNPPFPG